MSFLHSDCQLYVGLLKFPENYTQASFIHVLAMCLQINSNLHTPPTLLFEIILFCRVQSLDKDYREHFQSNFQWFPFTNFHQTRAGLFLCCWCHAPLRSLSWLVICHPGLSSHPATSCPPSPHCRWKQSPSSVLQYLPCATNTKVALCSLTSWHHAVTPCRISLPY